MTTSYLLAVALFALITLAAALLGRRLLSLSRVGQASSPVAFSLALGYGALAYAIAVLGLL
jgi:hypothetical protein